MSFTHALYYPWIDIRDLDWLKSAALYWDRISTIVPRSIAAPYESIEAKALQEEGVLSPLRVEADMPEVRQASQDFETHAHRPEAMAVLLPPGVVMAEEDWEVRESREHTFLHPDKMDAELRSRLLQTRQAERAGRWLKVNRDAANCYMTILAGTLAQNRGLALLADEQRFEPLANLVRRGEARAAGVPGARRMGEAALAHLSLQVVNITPDMPVEKILKFRRDHRDELARFRQAIGTLASQLDDEFPSLQAFQQQVHDVYVNELEPASDDLKSSLRAAGIKSFVSSLKTAAFSTPLSFLPAAVLAPTLGPLAMPAALFAGAAFSITAQFITFRLDRQNLLRKNPYSYVLAAQRVFGERRP